MQLGEIFSPVFHALAVEDGHRFVICCESVNREADLEAFVVSLVVSVVREDLCNEPQLLGVHCHERTSHAKGSSGHDELILHG